MILKNATILNGEFKFQRADIEVIGQTITKIAKDLKGDNEIDCGGKLILPGAIDIHSHGAANHDHCTPDKEGLARLCEYEAKNGVTSILPTTMTTGEDIITEAVKNVAEFIKTQKRGATPLGVHLEGPFFSMEKRGAQSPEYIKKPDFEMFKRFNDACGGIVKIVDVAPETEGAYDFIKKAKDVCTVSCGHTSGDYKTTMAAYEAGVTHNVHLYNAMTAANHREPGVVGAVWDSPENVTAELICDGMHVHPAIIRTTFKILGKRVVMISDSLSGTGLKDGEVFYDAAGKKVTIIDGLGRLDGGTIAGSTTNLFECMRRTVSYGIALEDAMYAASYAPAKVIGMEKVVGSIEVGKRADLVVTDQDLKICAVYVKGELQ